MGVISYQDRVFWCSECGAIPAVFTSYLCPEPDNIVCYRCYHGGIVHSVRDISALEKAVMEARNE